MQFDVQTVKLPTPICEKSTILDCQMQHGSASHADIIQTFGQQQRRANEPAAVDNELIAPKKLPNPCLESAPHQHLHREILFNNKIGKNVLNQKSELHRALEKYKDTQIKKELMRQKMESKSALEKAIEERAKKIESQEKPTSPEPEKLEFLQIHAKLCSKAPPDAAK